MKTLLLAAALALAPATDPAPAAAPAPGPGASGEPRPAMWLLADEDTRIYLFGTFHILPPGFRWRSAAFDEAARSADELVIEVTDEDVASRAEEVGARLTLGKLAPIHWRVSPDRRDALQEMLAMSGMPGEQLEGLQTWAVVMSMSVAAIGQAHGASPGEPLDLSEMPGVEDQLVEEFTASGRPISGVETVADQLDAFAALSFAEQRDMLEAMVDAYRDGGAAAVAGEGAGEQQWVRGDLEPLAQDLREMPAPLYDAIITRRNAAWADWLIARLERPGTVLFAVGAGHLWGEDSVQNMLAARGVTTTRLN